MTYKTLITLISTILITSSTYGQKENPCGTKDHRSEWLQHYQRNSDLYDKRGNETLYVPLTIHIVSNDDGEGQVISSNLIASLCTLNQDFADANIEFYIQDDFRYLSSTDMHIHTSTTDAAFQMFDLNVSNTINCYIVSNAAGNAGYNLPYAGVVINKTYLNPDDHTWAHEIGHNLSLPHPFLGWEGGTGYEGVPVGSPNSNESFSNPAPETVLYNYTLFKDTLILDTLIIDTAYVELVDGSNCSYAADGFCDTPPDYLAYRWPCTGAGFSTKQMKDPNGESFRSDASLIMSYANDDCAYRFSPEQQAAMRANLIDVKSEYLTNQNPAPSIDDPSITYLYPSENETLSFDHIELGWEPVENAKYYHIKLSLTSDLSFVVWDQHTTDTDIILEIDPIYADRDIYWSIAPFTDYGFCDIQFLETNTFFASATSGDNDIAQYRLWNIVPSIVQAGNTMYIDTETIINGSHICITDISGRRVLQSTINSNTIDIPEYWTAGIYIVQINMAGYTHTQKVVIQ